MKSVLKVILTCTFETDALVHSCLPLAQVDIHDSSDKRTDSGVDGLVHNSCDSRVPDLIDQLDPYYPETNHLYGNQPMSTSLYVQ